MANFMDKFAAVLEAKLMPVAAKIANQRHLQAVRDGIIITIPIIIVGSVFLILANLPIPALMNFYQNTPMGQLIQKWLSYPVAATFDLVAIITCLGIAYRLVERYKLDGISAAILALVSFFLVTPFKIKGENAVEVIGIPLGRMGSGGLFVAMMMAILSVEIFRIIVKKNLIVKMPDSVPPAVSKSFAALIPGAFIVTAALLIRIIFELSPFGDIHAVVALLLTKPLLALGTTYPGVVVTSLLIHLLWSTGLHGSSIVSGILSPIWLTLMDQNRVAFQAGKPVPNVVTAQFFDVFQNMGGSGTTFSLAILLLLFSKSRQLKEIGKLSIGPGCFNINEPIIFGLPIVMNPILIIPFILAPLVAVTITYWSMKLGLVAKPVGIAMPWTTPPFISGYIATGGKISGVVIQIITFLVSGMIYYPFFKMWDKKKVEEEMGE